MKCVIWAVVVFAVIVAAAPEPESYDFRAKYPDCVLPISTASAGAKIQAVVTAKVLSERFCVVQKTRLRLSWADLQSCDVTIPPGLGWEYCARVGICTADCYGNITVGTCPKECADHSVKKLYRVQPTSIKRYKTEAEIQAAVRVDGPVEATMEIFEDFLTYRGGVYTHSSGKLLGMMAVSIVGWGNAGTTPFWICTMEWGTQWGESGYFRILRGKDHCGIERSAIAGLPWPKP